MSEITTKLKVLGEKWANLPDCKEANEIADEVMEDLPELLSTIEELEKACAEMRDAINEAWNAFDNGKRKHHTDPLTGTCILGCQACAVEKLKHALSAYCGNECRSECITKGGE